MRVLLDTHAFLWYVLDDARLGADAKAVISDGANEVLVSAASFWETAIKVGLGKYSLSVPFAEFWQNNIDVNQFAVLGIEIKHAAILTSLPHHHRDPFDRLIVAQALAEGIPIVTADGAIRPYGVTVIW
jgi:PIN domain nuclease of toxin-antitoxin system